MQYLSQRLAARAGEDAGGRAPSGVRRRTSQRERLLDATEALIAEKGAARTTIEAIVKEAGVSSVTFYEHFRTRKSASSRLSSGRWRTCAAM